MSASDLANCCFDEMTGTVVSKYSDDSADNEQYKCNACIHCDDVCEKATSNPLFKEVCVSCNHKLNSRSDNRKRSSKRPVYTPCEISRHNTIGDCWVVFGKDVLDASSIILEHPGGIKSILRKAGTNSDCTKDFLMHSPTAKKMWKSLKIGTIIPCPGKSCSDQNGNADGKCCIS